MEIILFIIVGIFVVPVLFNWVRTLFDSDYKEPSDGKIAEDYPMEGINVFAELRYRF